MGNVMAAVAYIFNWLSGLIVFLISKDDKVARFHGMQSILLTITYFVIFIVVAILAFILSMVIVIGAGAINVPMLATIGAFTMPIVMILYLLVVFLVWLWCIWQAWNDRIYKLPLIGGLAEKWSK